MGLTWIDHDTIEKPIEEITLGTEEADDIEFTVETLKSKAESDRKANMHKKVDIRVIDTFSRGAYQLLMDLDFDPLF